MTAAINIQAKPTPVMFQASHAPAPDANALRGEGGEVIEGEGGENIDQEH